MSYQDPPHEWLDPDAQRERLAAQQKLTEQFKSLFPQKAVPEEDASPFATQRDQLKKMEEVLKAKIAQTPGTHRENVNSEYEY
jgi:hypothetical protein